MEWQSVQTSITWCSLSLTPFSLPHPHLTHLPLLSSLPLLRYVPFSHPFMSSITSPSTTPSRQLPLFPSLTVFSSLLVFLAPSPPPTPNFYTLATLSRIYIKGSFTFKLRQVPRMPEIQAIIITSIQFDIDRQHLETLKVDNCKNNKQTGIEARVGIQVTQLVKRMLCPLHHAKC